MVFEARGWGRPVRRQSSRLVSARGAGQAIGCLALTLGLLFGSGDLQRVVAAEATGAVYAQPTGHTLAGPFLARWLDGDGATTLGLPVTEPVDRDGQTLQFFQFGALVAPAGGAADAAIEPLAVGRELLRARHDPERTVAGRRAGADRAAAAFDRSPADGTATGTARSFVHRAGLDTALPIRAYYDEHGGADRFGRPLSAPYVVAGMLVQWFEFGRLQAWSKDGTEELDVWAAPVGWELARILGVDTRKVRQGRLPLLDLETGRAHGGDGTIPEAAGPFAPTRIMVPAIGIDAAIEQVAIVNGVMGTPADAWNVGWYPVISGPGHGTNVVMAGHKDWWNVGPVVFADLGSLGGGEKIYVMGPDGTGFTYVVTAVWAVDAAADASAVTAGTGGESLTLITCTGSFNGGAYDSRLIVRAERV